MAVAKSVVPRGFGEKISGMAVVALAVAMLTFEHIWNHIRGFGAIVATVGSIYYYGLANPGVPGTIETDEGTMQGIIPDPEWEMVCYYMMFYIVCVGIYHLRNWASRAIEQDIEE